MGMMFSSNTVGAVKSCPSKSKLPSKQERYNESMATIAKGKKSSDPEKVEAAKRLEKNNKAVERARLSSDVYHSDKVPRPTDHPVPEGWKQLDQKKLHDLGIRDDMLLNDKTGFKAAVYESSFEEKPPKYVVAFAGTEGQWGDIKADLTQGLGMETEQYNEAKLLAKTIQLNGGGSSNVEFTGHSLGGGLASAASAVTGSKATTMNAAGLHPKTAKKLGIDKELMDERAKNIDSFTSKSDPLNNVSDNLPIPSSLGTRYEIEPAPQHSHTWKGLIVTTLAATIANPLLGVIAGIAKAGQMALDGHSITNMEDNIEHAKLSDESKIYK